VIVYHVAVQTADDYLQKREPHRKAHLERLMGLRSQGLVIGGGPAPDGRGADVFYRVQQPDDVRRLVEEDPYMTGGVWATYTPRSFAQFLEPWELPPLVTDGSRKVTLVEGVAPDVEMASFALIEARGGGRMASAASSRAARPWRSCAATRREAARRAARHRFLGRRVAAGAPSSTLSSGPLTLPSPPEGERVSVRMSFRTSSGTRNPAL
jgi:uncharacterized protein YciI